MPKELTPYELLYAVASEVTAAENSEGYLILRRAMNYVLERAGISRASVDCPGKYTWMYDPEVVQSPISILRKAQTTVCDDANEWGYEFLYSDGTIRWDKLDDEEAEDEDGNILTLVGTVDNDYVYATTANHHARHPRKRALEGLLLLKRAESYLMKPGVRSASPEMRAAAIVSGIYDALFDNFDGDMLDSVNALRHVLGHLHKAAVESLRVKR